MNENSILTDPLAWILLLLFLLILLLLWWIFFRPPVLSESVILYNRSIEKLDCDGQLKWQILSWLDGPRNILINVQNKGACPVNIFARTRGRDFPVLQAAPGPVQDLGAGPIPSPGFPTATGLPLRRGMIVYAVCGCIAGEPECKFDIEIKTV